MSKLLLKEKQQRKEVKLCQEVIEYLMNIIIKQ